jgi:hypothetical protein
MVVVFWVFVGLVLAAVLVTAWRMDAAVRRRGARVRHHSEVFADVRENNRDAEVKSPFVSDNSWTSHSRRNQR